MIEPILIAAGVIGVLSLLVGVLLGVFGRVFHVEVDEKEVAVREALPGNNCGGCGYAGCDGLAAAIAAGEASVNACPVGGQACADAIGAIMGVEAEEMERQVAFVLCAGTCDKTVRVADYYGIKDCRQAVTAPGYAGKSCPTGCFGLGTCASVCPTGAIRLMDGVAAVAPAKCICCGRCVAACPQHIIGMRPQSQAVAVACSSHKAGKAVNAVCAAGCIACGICQKVCPYDAIHVTDNLAAIDPAKCTACGTCVTKCPVKVIHLVNG